MDYQRYLDAVQSPSQAGKAVGYSAAHVRLLCSMGLIAAEKRRGYWLVVVPSLKEYAFEQSKKRAKSA